MSVNFIDYIDVISGGTPSTNNKEYWNGDIPWLSIDDFKEANYYVYSTKKFITKLGLDNSSTNLLHKNDIIISARGTVGKIALIYKDMAFNQSCFGLRIKKSKNKELNPIFLFYYLKTNLKYLLKVKHDSIFDTINLETFKYIKLNLPDRKTQDKIVETLSNIDNQIERNNTMVKRLQDLATSTYSRWFNQFEFPNEDGLPYKSNNGKFVYSEKLKRNIPIGWEVKELLDLIEWKSSSQPPKSDFIDEYKKGYIRFIQNRDYDADNHITYIPLTQNTKTCTKYDIMIDKYGDAGKTRYGLEGAFNVALAKIEPKCVNQQEFIRKYIEQECIYVYLNNACIASTRASLNELVFKGLKIVVPTNKILKDFEIIMKNIINQILDIANNTNELNNLKSKLLPLLINGQLEV